MGKTGSKQLNPPIEAGDVNRDDQSKAEIFKLKMDHFEELFDFLSLQDLVALGQTCKRMQCIVGYYIREIYTAVKFQSTFDGIKITNKETNLNELSSYVKRIWFRYLEFIPDNSKRQQKWWRKWRGKSPPQIIPYMKADQFKSLNEIQLIRVALTKTGIERIKDVLGQLETVKLKYPHFYSSDAYNELLQYCTNVKHLCVKGPSSTSSSGKTRSTESIDGGWLLQKYPKLEHFELSVGTPGPIVKLSTFFELNTSVKTFATSNQILLDNRDTFKTTKAKLDILSVRFLLGIGRSPPNPLNELYDNGFFKELHVYYFPLLSSLFDQKSVDALISFRGLTKLYIDGMEDGTDLSSLTDLKQLYVERASCIPGMTMLATELVNLEFIQFTYANVDDILPFVRHSTKLTTIVVHRLKEIDEVIFKIEQLNGERLEFPNAQKITIYVNESVYLAVKWAKNQTDWGLVEIKRGASYDGLNHCFDYIYDLNKTF